MHNKHALKHKKPQKKLTKQHKRTHTSYKGKKNINCAQRLNTHLVTGIAITKHKVKEKQTHIHIYIK